MAKPKSKSSATMNDGATVGYEAWPTRCGAAWTPQSTSTSPSA